MAILSETAIRQRLAKGELIEDGAPAMVRGASYPCHAARVLPGGPGTDGKPPEDHDWTGVMIGGGMPRESCRIAPRQIVWVRIKEKVCLPADVCAFWWQTNSLSRKGLMLVNMSMVDAGYIGYLACLFVNFGREPVDIDPGMTVARLVFQTIDSANVPYGSGGDVADYDRGLREVALHGPSSFLSFQEFSTTFATEKDKALADFTKAKDDALAEMKTSIANQTQEEYRKNIDNLPKFLLKSYAAAGVGLALLTVAMIGAQWWAGHSLPKTADTVAKAVDADLGRRFQTDTAATLARTAALEQRVRQLEDLLAAKALTTIPVPGKPDAGH